MYIFSCIDCHKVFTGDEYKAHTSCISEAEKYQGALYKGDKKNKNAKKNNNAATPKKEEKPAKKEEQKAEKRPREAEKAATEKKPKKQEAPKKKNVCCDKLKEKIRDEIEEQIGGVGINSRIILRERVMNSLSKTFLKYIDSVLDDTITCDENGKPSMKK